MSQNSDTEQPKDLNQEAEPKYLELPLWVTRATPKPTALESCKKSVFDCFYGVGLVLIGAVILPLIGIMRLIEILSCNHTKFNWYSELDDPTSLASLMLRINQTDSGQNAENEDSAAQAKKN